MKAIQVRDMSSDELSDALKRLQRERLNLRFQQATGQLENVSRIRTVRRDIARIESIRRERMLMDATKQE